MTKIQNIVNHLKVLALNSQLNKKHAAAVIINGSIITTGLNTNRTYQKSFRHLYNTSICCSTHAEMEAIRKAQWRIL